MHPSQVRYVRYFNRLVRERFVYAAKPLMLLAVEFSECPVVNGLLCSKPLRSFSNKTRVRVAAASRRVHVEPLSCRVLLK